LPEDYNVFGISNNMPVACTVTIPH